MDLVLRICICGQRDKRYRTLKPLPGRFLVTENVLVTRLDALVENKKSRGQDSTTMRRLLQNVSRVLSHRLVIRGTPGQKLETFLHAKSLLVVFLLFFTCTLPSVMWACNSVASRLSSQFLLSRNGENDL